MSPSIIHIVIDIRENSLWHAIHMIQESRESMDRPKDIQLTFTKEKLDVGDIIFYVDGIERLVVERKTHADLQSSIRDGRYREQMVRMKNSIDGSTTKILYLLEGAGSSNSRIRMQERIHTQSTLFSISYFHDCMIWQTDTLTDTAHWIYNVAYKFHRVRDRFHSFHRNNNTDTDNTKEEKCEEGDGNGDEIGRAHV